MSNDVFQGPCRIHIALVYRDRGRAESARSYVSASNKDGYFWIVEEVVDGESDTHFVTMMHLDVVPGRTFDVTGLINSIPACPDDFSFGQVVSFTTN